MKSEEWIKEHKQCLENYRNYAINQKWIDELTIKIDLLEEILED